MNQPAERSPGSDRPEELWVSLGELEKAVAKTPARGVPKPLFIAVAALALVAALVAAYLLYFDSDYQRSLSQAHAVYEHASQERDEAQAGLAAAQEELARVRTELAQTQAELASAQDAIDLLEEYSLAAPDGTVPEYTRLYPEMAVPAWEGERITGGKVCCLTFDDGPSANTDRVLEILDRYGVKATFFVVGRTGQADQARMKKSWRRATPWPYTAGPIITGRSTPRWRPFWRISISSTSGFTRSRGCTPRCSASPAAASTAITGGCTRRSSPR